VGPAAAIRWMLTVKCCLAEG